MTMCPYKWFLYLASIWAVLYVMLEAWTHVRAANDKLADPSFDEKTFEESDEETDDDDDDIDDATLEKLGWTKRAAPVLAASR